MTTIFTIGHSRHPAERFVALLGRHGVATLVDVRRRPGSRLNPQFNRERLAAALAAAGIGYVHLEDLGGLREGEAAGAAADAGWRSPFLRSYAGHARTTAFGAALGALLDEAGRAAACIMCAEGDWRQCHRQIVADYLLTRGVAVRHIMPDGAVEAGALTPFARPRDDGTVDYPKAEDRQLGLGLT
jgi:uncharacterized protein (DUF488 family)